MTKAQEPAIAPKKADFDVGEWMENRAKFIPLRLQMEERKYLRL